MTRPAGRLTAADDLLVHQLPRPAAVVHDPAEEWFDRLYFCAHGHDDGPVLVLGAGVYPNAMAIDGYACLVAEGAQRNLRFSDDLGSRLRTAVGPLRWEVLDPLSRWRLVVGENPCGFELDAVYTARSEPWLVEPIAVRHDAGPATEFAHFFQCGRWEGALTIDGRRLSIDGWLGARDRSWGIRRARERLGMHLWIAAHFDDYSVAVHYNEHRDGSQQHCGGALLPDDREPVPIASLAHDIRLDPNGELLSAELGIPVRDEVLEVRCHALHAGVYMAGAGYGGWHGRRRGPGHLEAEAWELDGTQNPRELPIRLVDKVCRFEAAGRTGIGLAELALSRSSAYSYAPRRSARAR